MKGYNKGELWVGLVLSSAVAIVFISILWAVVRSVQ